MLPSISQNPESPLEALKSASVGGSHTLVISISGRCYSYGFGAHGCLGLGNLNNQVCYHE